MPYVFHFAALHALREYASNRTSSAEWGLPNLRRLMHNKCLNSNACGGQSSALRVLRVAAERGFG